MWLTFWGVTTLCAWIIISLSCTMWVPLIILSELLKYEMGQRKCRIYDDRTFKVIKREWKRDKEFMWTYLFSNVQQFSVLACCLILRSRQPPKCNLKQHIIIMVVCLKSWKHPQCLIFILIGIIEKVDIFIFGSAWFQGIIAGFLNFVECNYVRAIPTLFYFSRDKKLWTSSTCMGLALHFSLHSQLFKCSNVQMLCLSKKII